MGIPYPKYRKPVFREADTPLKESFRSEYNRFIDNLNGSGDVYWKQLREEAFQDFVKLGFPAKKNEEYKYTNITRALEKHFDPQDLPALKNLADQIDEDKINAVKFDVEANHVVFVNGQFSEKYTDIVSSDKDIVIKPVSKAFQENAETFKQYFGKHADSGADPFVALNMAFAVEGYYIEVPKGKAIEKPVFVYFISDSSQGKLIRYNRNLIIGGENSQAQVIEVYNSFGEEVFYNNHTTEIYNGQASVINHTKLGYEKDLAYHTGTTEVYQEKDSNFTSNVMTLGGAMIRNNINVTIDAEGCETHLYGLYLLNNEQHVDNHTMVDHRKPNSYSNELYKGIYDDKSHGVFNGKVYVQPEAQQTNAFQANNNILLTDEAKVDTKPQLEIWADDVSCSHGATTGQMDEEALFYMRSRGLSKNYARALLLQAFAYEALAGIKNDQLKAFIEEQIAARLTNKS